MSTTTLASEFTAFLASLESSDASTDAQTDGQTADASRAIDLYSLFAAMTALQGEVRGEARLFKGALDDFKAVFDTLQASQALLREELEQSRRVLGTQKQSLLKPVLLDWLDARDRLVASIEHLTAIKPRGFGAKLRKGRLRLIETLLKGQQMSLAKLDAQLARHEVLRLETLGRPLDPTTMRALTVDNDSEQPDGVVTSELASGFLWQDKLLRYAEVGVNKLAAN